VMKLPLNSPDPFFVQIEPFFRRFKLPRRQRWLY
jgi:hypothetical protein